MGVETIPIKSHSTLICLNPSLNALSISSPETLVSFPIKIFFVSFFVFFNDKASLKKKSLTIGNSPNFPLIPSVPKYFFFIRNLTSQKLSKLD